MKFILLFVIIILLTVSIVSFTFAKEPHPYDPWEEEPPIDCYRCNNGLEEGRAFFQPTCPPGWSETRSDCSEPLLKCWQCTPEGIPEYEYFPSEYHTVCPPRYPIGPQENQPECSGSYTKPSETRTATVQGNFVPYIYDSSHGYLSTSQLKQMISEKFNNWEDNPYRSGHVCRHMCMEIEEYLEKELAIDCFWGRGEKYWSDGHRTTHVWLYILTENVNNPNNIVFYSFDSNNLAWKLPTSDCGNDENRMCGYTLIEINHGNYIYGKRILKDGEPYIFRISNYANFDYIPDDCPQCSTYPYQYSPGDPMYDAVLPLSLWNTWMIGLGIQ